MKAPLYLFISLSIILSLSCTTDSLKEGNKKKKSAQKGLEMNKTNEENLVIEKYGMAEHPNNSLGGLKVGDVAPDFKLEDENGEGVSLEESLKEGPVLIVFYRADWCPYCTKHLAEFQDKINAIKDKGVASVIAISPQLQKYSKELKGENQYTFPILYDADHEVMKDYKVFFRVTDEYNEKILKMKGDYVQTRNGDTNPWLPVPATYMIGTDKRIKFVHYDANYRLRANIDEALNSI